ncbi:MAG TPA: hypothetical protein VME69_06535 [Methylocella sp.]|nr:hypothetical protein [Methylocella sp.]
MTFTVDPTQVLSDIETYVPMAISAAAVAATQFPPPKDPNSWWGQLYAVINWLGMNWGYAKNVSAAPATPATPAKS